MAVNDGKLANGAGNENPLNDGLANVLLNMASKPHSTAQIGAKCLRKEIIMIQFVVIILSLLRLFLINCTQSVFHLSETLSPAAA